MSQASALGAERRTARPEPSSPEPSALRADANRSLDARCVVLREPASPQARSYRLLRHHLLTHADPRILVVTSATDGEGKTTCAVNLALCIAEETLADVLLLEANPGRPSLARMFGMKWTEDDVRAPKRGVVATPGSRLHVGSASACATASGGLDRLLFHAAVRDLRLAYEYIVVDTASVLESADADVACECADGVLVAARAGRSRRGLLREACEQLQPAVLSGIVLLGA